jgi:membrane protease YdiL (CAAX protease family)
VVKLTLGDVMASGNRARATVELSGAMAAEIIVFVILVSSLRRRDLSLAELGLRPGAPPRGWVAAAAVAALFIWFNLALPLREVTTLWEMSLFRVYNGLMAGVTAGVVEEVFFRGYMMTELDRAGFGSTIQVVVSAILYGAVHSVWGVTSGMFTMQLVGGAVIGTAIFGAFCSAVYLASGRRLWPVIVAHAAIDLVIEPWLFLVALSMAAQGA